MSKLERLLEEFQTICAAPARQVEAFEAETGKKAVGVFPLYVPEEIIHASGRLPVGLWGGSGIAISEARAFLPAFACSIMQSVMELSLRGVYDGLEVVVIPSPCDTLKCMGQKWKGKCPSLQFVHPQNRGLAAANRFLEAEYAQLRARLEQILAERISDEAIARSIEIYNENRRVMRRFTAVAARYPDLISPAERHAVIKARFFMDKSRHTALVEQLLGQLEGRPVQPWTGKRALLSGITAEPAALLDLLREYGFAVVADDLAQESRQFGHDVPQTGTPLGRLAAWWQEMKCCSTAIDTRKGRLDTLVERARVSGADAVIVCMMKFCDPEEFDYPILRKKMLEAGIPVLCIEVDQEATGFEQIRTRVQSFSEMLQ